MYENSEPTIRHWRITWNLNPTLTDILNTLADTPIGQSFKDRAVEVAQLKVLSDPVDKTTALAPYLWVLKNTEGEGLPLTAAGYLKPAHVRELAALMPVMTNWLFKMTREIDVRPVLDFRENLKRIGLVRKYKSSLRLTKLGKQALADPEFLWQKITQSLIPNERSFSADAAVIILVHSATSEDEIDTKIVAKTLSSLGWEYPDGSEIDRYEAYPTWNHLWNILGNIGDFNGGQRGKRVPSKAARIMMHEALFTEVPPRRESAGLGRPPEAK